jgi:6,7-dimethyl-8-ribityllumazine synthase
MRETGELDGRDLSIAIVVARDHEHVSRRLLRGAEDALGKHGVGEPDVYRVVTSFELPVVALALAEKGEHDAIVCLGALVGENAPEFEQVAAQAAAGIMQVQLDTGVPITLGLLATEDVDEALARSGPKNNRGGEAAEAALQAANLLRQIQG